jgi:polysaccharide export outer membrane protein
LLTISGVDPLTSRAGPERPHANAGGFTPRAYRYDFVISCSSMGVTVRQKAPLIAPVRPGDTVTVSERWF